MSEIFERLCRQSPLNLPENMRADCPDNFAETQGNFGPLDGLAEGRFIEKKPPISFFGLCPPPDGTTPSSHGLSYTPEGLVACPPHVAARLRAIRSLDEDSCCSFTEWKSAGYWVTKGSKSYFTDALGIPQFTKEQVTKSRW